MGIFPIKQKFDMTAAFLDNSNYLSYTQSEPRPKLLQIAIGRALPKLRYLNTYSTIHIKKLNSIIVCTYPKLGRKIADPQSSLTSELLASTLAVEWAHPLFCPLILKKVIILLAINVQICNKNWLSTIEV